MGPFRCNPSPADTTRTAPWECYSKHGRPKQHGHIHDPEEYRLEILARVMDGFVKNLKSGVNQGDLAEPNVILVPDDKDPSAKQSLDNTLGELPLPRVVIIDYNHATVDSERCSSQESLPETPISIFWDQNLWADFNRWVPSEWEDGKSNRKWLIRRFNGDGQRQFCLPLREYGVQELHEYHDFNSNRPRSSSGKPGTLPSNPGCSGTNPLRLSSRSLTPPPRS